MPKRAVIGIPPNKFKKGGPTYRPSYQKRDGEQAELRPDGGGPPRRGKVKELDGGGRHFQATPPSVDRARWAEMNPKESYPLHSRE